MSSSETSEVREDTVIELAPALTVPAIHDATAVEIDRYGTRATPSLGSLEQQTCNPESPGTMQSPDLSTRHHKSAFGEQNTGFQAGHVQGNLNVNYYHNGPLPPASNVNNRSLFDSLVLQENSFTGRQLTPITELKMRHRAARLSTAEIEPIESYVPYVSVKDRNIKAHLCHIAKLFQFIDTGFSEYFQVVILRLPRLTVDQYLDLARSRVERKQARGANKSLSDSPIDLGDLGSFYANAFDRRGTGDEDRFRYDITDCTQEDLLHYLQDAFEIPYWQFMLDLFLQENVNSRSLSATAVFRVLSSLKLEVLNKREGIRRDLAASKDSRREDIEPLMRGIDARVAVLEEAWYKETFEFEAGELLGGLFRPSDPVHSFPLDGEPATPAENQIFTAWPTQQEVDQKDAITFIALIALFFIASLIPGYKAFSISINDPGTGSISDADFWNLLQSSVIAVLGSLMSVIPLMRGSYFAAART